MLQDSATTKMVKNILDGTTPVHDWATDAEIAAVFAKPFADATAEEIAELAENGVASLAFSVGDEKTITLTTGEQITLVILGFDKDELADGSGTAGISLGMKELLQDTYAMYDETPTTVGWKQSEMRTVTMQTLLGRLPPDWRAAVKSVTKTSGFQDLVSTSDQLFLFSRAEIDPNYGGSKVYEFWEGKGSPDRVKHLSNGSGDAYIWWLRDNNLSVAVSGNIATTPYPTTPFGVCFGFCV